SQVVYHPQRPNFILTASEDGIMNFFNTSVAEEEEALESVLNAESPVRTVGFFGVEGEHLNCCTNCETLSLWHPQAAQRI
ncbi:unnamed protein product, partial [Discosporangium mesarthrocarpum]